MTSNRNKLVSLTDFSTGEVFQLSSCQIIAFHTVASTHTLIAYVDQRGKVKFDRKVVEAASTIATACISNAVTILTPVTLTTGIILYLNIDRMIYVDNYSVVATAASVFSATIVAAGSGGTPGPVTMTGTTGTGTPFQATGVIAASGSLDSNSPLVITVAGSYTVLPTVLTLEPVTATASLTGANLSLTFNKVTQVTYDYGINSPKLYKCIFPIASVLVGLTDNLFGITTQPTSSIPSRLRYINNEKIDVVTPQKPAVAPVITFTTNVKTGTGVVGVVGTGYTNPTIAITGGGGTLAMATVGTKVITASVVAGGSGGTPGLTTFTGTTGTGVKFTCTGTIGGGGVLSGALTVVIQGAYGAGTPITNIAAEPITGGSLTGATVSVSLGLNVVTITAQGSGYTSYPTFTVVDGTGINGTVTAGMAVDSPLVIVNGGKGINSAVTLTFSATSGTLATATATVSSSLETVTATSLTNAGNYVKGTDTYPTLTISGGSGSVIFLDEHKTEFRLIPVEETVATIVAAVNAL